MFARISICPAITVWRRSILRSMIALLLQYFPIKAVELINWFESTPTRCSCSAIAKAICDASAGLLKVQSYTKDKFNMVTIMFRTGGWKLLYAANHGLGLPSVNTI